MTDNAADPTEALGARAQHENDLAALRAENARVVARLGVTADRLAEAEETLRAIRSGEIDALVVSTTGGDRLFTLAGADHPYRVMVESIKKARLPSPTMVSSGMPTAVSGNCLTSRCTG